ncbi:hypothetical protein [Christiangramia sabulilitoris]|uniref:Uncharacterized protein n=1 Tax=Christiangramia sabulilitoris TaxID=2583991 RepID=A0A550I8L2_9FLAO|nr:hypothetical protein [Christiangramia sabulilitoris]TRO67286.1 hypothetical protein FGM01_05230 [Christiangramia sabulilitoris]
MKISVFLILCYSAITFFQQPVQNEYKVTEATLCLGDQLPLNGSKQIVFKKVISDSRCPIEVTCVWAGEVKVLLEFYEDGKRKGEKIVTVAGVDISEVFGVENLLIQGLKVEPYPSIKSKTSDDEYRLWMKISEENN